MKLTVIGTGSKGNCYLLTANNGETLIIEAGVHISKINQALNHDFSKVVGCIMTHEHGDHSRAYLDLMLGQAVDIYTSRKTHEVFSENPPNLSHRAKTFSETGNFLGEFRILPFDVKHDAADPLGFLIHHKECGKVLFLTDTYFCGYTFAGLNNVIIEANYCENIVAENYGDAAQEFLKDRIAQSHMSLKTCISTLKTNDLQSVNNIVLIHLSDLNSNQFTFATAVTEATGKNVVVASDGLVMEFNKTPF